MFRMNYYLHSQLLLVVLTRQFLQQQYIFEPICRMSFENNVTLKWRIHSFSIQKENVIREIKLKRWPFPAYGKTSTVS